MSEPNSEQQQEGEAIRQIRQIFQEELKKMQASQTQSTPSTIESKSPAQAGTEHKHFTLEEAFKNDCPDCANIKTQIGKQFLKEEMKRRMTNPYECEDCGTRISYEELKEDCPTCGSKKARNR